MLVAFTGFGVSGLNTAPAAEAAPLSTFSKTGIDLTNPSTATATTAGSARPGDTVKWVLDYKNSTTTDADVSITDPITGGQTYVDNSLQLPPGFTGSVANGTLTAKGPVLQGTTSAASPVFSSQPVNFNTPGGDGYSVEGYKNNIYTVFHHNNSSTVVFCATLAGAVCPGWPALSTYVDPKAGTPLGTGTAGAYHTAHINGSFISSGRLYWPVSLNLEYGMQCLDLDARVSCGYTHLGTSPAATHVLAGDGIAAADGNYYYLALGGNLHCVAPDGTACGAVNVTVGGILATGYSFEVGTYGRYVYVTYINAARTSDYLSCFDTVTRQLCAGFPIATGAPQPVGFSSEVFPVVSSNGDLLGACAVYGSVCYAPTGAALANPWSQRIYSYGAAGQGYGTGVLVGTKYYTGNANVVDCYDFAQPLVAGKVQPCTRFTTHPPNLRSYTVRPLANLPGCFASNGDGGRIGIFNGETGAPCASASRSVQLTPDVYYCDGKSGHTTSWGSVSLPGLDGSQYYGATLTLTGANGAPVPGWTDVPFPKSGPQSIDISSIPVSGNTASLTATVSLAAVNSPTAVDAAKVKVTWVGDSVQVCYRTVAPPVSCQQTLPVTNNATAVTTAGGTSDAPGQTTGTVTFNVAPSAEQCMLHLIKTANPATARPGDPVTYTIKVANTGTQDYVAANPASLSDSITKVLGDSSFDPASLQASAGTATYDQAGKVIGWSGPLAAGATATITYTVKVNDPDTGAHLMTNRVVTPPGTASNCAAASTDKDCAADVPVQSLRVVKTTPATQVTAGEKVDYTVTVTNTGAADYTAAAPASFSDDLTAVLDDAVYNNDAAATSGAVSYAAPTLSWSGPLPVNGTVTVTYSVRVNNPGTGDQKLDNTVVTPTGSGGNCAPGSTDPACRVQIPAKAFSLVKTASQPTANLGDTVTYTLKVTNTGATDYTAADPASFTDDLSGVLDDATYNDNALATAGAVQYTAPTFTWSGPLAMGASATITYSVTVNTPDDNGDRLLHNTVTSPPGSGGSCVPGNTDPACRSDVPIPDDPKLTLTKSASTGTLVAGQEITYTFDVKNTGNVTLKDVKVNETAFTGSGKLSAITCPAAEAASLAPGATVTCTATYTVTQADVDAGSVKNTATATGTPPRGGSPVSPPADATVTANDKPALALVKTGHSSKPNELIVGEQARYDFTVTNTGNVTLKDVKVTETAFTGSGTMSQVTCPPAEAASLAPGAAVTCTATYTVTQADVDAGSIKNTATSTGTPPRGEPPVSPPADALLPAPEQPAVALVKTASTDKATVGEEISYTFAVTNTGNVTLTDVKVNEGTFTGSGKLSPVTCPNGAASLAPGATVLCTATYTVTQADVDGGSVKNSATATGTPPSGPPPVSPPSEVTVPAPSNPALTVVKTASSSQPDTLTVGETVNYTFAVKNTGNVTLKDVKVNETAFTGSGKLSAITCPAAEAASLAPGATVTCTATYTVTQADVDAGSIKNTATSTGTPPSGPPPVSPPSEAVVPAPSEPAVSLVKSASTRTLVAGEAVTYSFAVTNTGNVTLKDVKVNEGEFTGSGKLSAITCPAAEAASLAPGATVTCTATYTVTQADVDAGSVKNTATSTGTPPSGEPPVSPPSQVVLTTTDAPGVALVKSSSTGTLVAGEEVIYKFEVKNTGNVSLKDVKVNEGEFTGSGKLSAVTCPPAEAASLTPGATVTCTATYTVTQADVDAGSIKNTATATGTPPRGEPPVSPPAQTVATTADKPALSLVKTGHSSKPDELVVGETVRYHFTVTNTGNLTLKDVKVNETAFTGSGQLSAVTCPPAEAASLAPGATVTCTATYTVTQADVDAGSIKNTATSTGTPPRGEASVSPPADALLPAPEQPAVALVKSSSTGTLVAGERITYTFAVTNTGNVTLTDVKINETAFTGSGKVSAVTCPKEAATLAPGAAVLCTAAYTVTQADVDAGSVKNTATATGTPPKGQPPVSPPSDTTATTTDQPSLTLLKSATTGQDDKLVTGEKITYSFTVRNTGNVTLKDVKINEGRFTGHGTLDPVTCPEEAVALAPGTTVSCTAGYTVTQADVDAGSVTNTATATGTPPRGEPPVSPPSEVELPQAPKPAVALVKSAQTEKPGRLVTGEKVAYTFAVTNTGNVTLKDVTIKEGAFTGHGKLDAVTCPSGAASLAPGATVSCTAGYTVTQADVDAGTVKNTATATGTPPRGEPPVSPPSDVTIPSNGKGVLGLTKTADVTDTNKTGRNDTGDRIDWKLTIANQGTLTVTDIKVDDPTAGDVTCPRTSLAPGETMMCTTQPHTITTQDAQRGKVVNTATATGKAGNATLTSPEATATVKVEHDTPAAPGKPGGPAAPKPSGILAHTGTAVLTVVGIAGGLLIVGALALGHSRRRRNQ
ncbi:hypothetical protein [Kitasatospora sp. NPDC057500]|uniref:DUF7507 domain-containing protein n=1 Tax=Kitasatospora sp. NPDC057500 TaxID=3346151 RepID=UPI003690E1D8